MQGVTAIMLATIIIGLPTVMIMLIANRFFKFREKKLEVEALNAAEKAAQYASRSHELEERVRVLEQIVTDGGVQTAAQIEAQTSLAAEKSAQYAQHMERFEARLRVLEQIVTDSGAQTAQQIEALREQARIPVGDKAQ